MAHARTIRTRGSNVRIGDYRITADWGGGHNGYVVESIITLGHGPLGAIIELYGANGTRETIYGDDTYRVERTYA